MTRLGLGLFTVRALDEPMSETLERAADIGYEGVEFVERTSRHMDFESVAETLDDTGLEPLGVHLWLHQLEEDLPALADQYSTLGCDTFVIPYHPETNFRTAKRMGRLAERLNAVAERAGDLGFEVLYHPNHWDLVPLFDDPILGRIPSLRVTKPTESVSQDLQLNATTGRNGYLDWIRRVEDAVIRRRNKAFDRALLASGLVADNDVRTLVMGTPLGYLLAETDTTNLRFQLDVSFLVQQGYDPADVIAHLSDRIRSVHAKDVKTEEYSPGFWPSFVDAGEGRVNFEGVVDAAQRNGIEWIIFENGHAEDPLRSIRGGADVLRSAGLRSKARP